MHTDLIFVLGAGGHGKVVLDALLESGIYLSQIRICDEASNLQGTEFMGCVIDAPAVINEMAESSFHLAIG